MQIIVDADACPKVIKEILYRTAQRSSIKVTFVANTFLRLPQSVFLKSIIVSASFNEADDKIVEFVSNGDLVITADIPLADRVIKKGAYALNPRGDFYSEENISSRLALRDLLHELREGGLETGGPPPLCPRDRQTFAQNLQFFITHKKAPF